MSGAVAAGHPLTAEIGARILSEGGNAVDACVAAAFAAMVTESPLTSPGAGGFMLVRPGNGAPPRLIDCFVAAPGLGLRRPRSGEMEIVDVGFGETTTQPFRIGPASSAVPGLVAGLEQAHQRYGRLPWAELVTPAAELARHGVELSQPQAHLHALLDPILRAWPEGRKVYGRPGGERLVAGDRLVLSDLANTLETVGQDGAAALDRGELAHAIVGVVREGDGQLTLEDLAAYQVAWRRPVSVDFRDHTVISNGPPSSGGLLIAYGLALLERLPDTPAGSVAALAALAEVMAEQSRARDASFSSELHRGGLAKRLLSAPQLDEALRRIERRLGAEPESAPIGGTTHVSVVDATGNAASLSSSTGSGSGVIVPGTGIYLNNMLGEFDLVGGRTIPAGRRLTSMMAPSIVVNPDGSPRLVVGSAGSARLRGAIMQIVVNVIEHGLGVSEAIAAPRVHVDESHLHCEGGIEPEVLAELEARGYDVVRWRRRNLFFGGAAAVEVLPDGSVAAAGDPRRGGAGVVVG